MELELVLLLLDGRSTCQPSPEACLENMEGRASNYMIAGIFAGIFAAVLAIMAFKRQKGFKGKQWRQIGVVKSLHVYPVKSCAGINLQEAECGFMGVKHDRKLMFLSRIGTPATQRTCPTLALIKTEIHGSSVTLRAPDLTPLTLSLDQVDEVSNYERHTVSIFGLKTEGVVISEEANAWICKYLNRENYKVLGFPRDAKPRALRTDENFGAAASENDEVVFADQCPYLLLSEESLRDLNKRLPDQKMTMSRFRPNIVIGGCRAYEEDTIKRLRIGSAEFRGLHCCGRCTVPTVNQETGVRQMEEPLKTLRQYRIVPGDPRYGDAPIFGINLGADKPGTVSVGDPVFAITS